MDEQIKASGAEVELPDWVQEIKDALVEEWNRLEEYGEGIKSDLLEAENGTVVVGAAVSKETEATINTRQPIRDRKAELEELETTTIDRLEKQEDSKDEKTPDFQKIRSMAEVVEEDIRTQHKYWDRMKETGTKKIEPTASDIVTRVNSIEGTRSSIDITKQTLDNRYYGTQTSKGVQSLLNEFENAANDIRRKSADLEPEIRNLDNVVKTINRQYGFN